MVVVNPAACFKISGAFESSGKLSTTRLTLSRTSLAAESKSISVSNSIRMVLLPFSEVESMLLMPSAPPTTSSMI